MTNRLPGDIPSEDLHTVIEHAYGAKTQNVREAAGRVDTWVAHTKWYFDYVRRIFEMEKKPMTNIRLTEQQLTMEAITEGIRLGFMDMLRSGTDMPGADFYAAVQDGIEKGMEGVTWKDRAS